MVGNTFGQQTDDTVLYKRQPLKGGLDGINYALRITFGIVHSVILTLFSFGLAILFPSLSHLLFACIAPLLSLLLTIFCNGCIEYVSRSTLTVAHILKTAWIPPLGIFCVSLILLPLELMPGFGPINNLVITSIILNFMLTLILQVYAARDIQESPAKSAGSSGPM